MATKTLSQVQQDAQSLFAEIQQKGITVADKANIVTAANKLLSLLNDLQPHINDASSAFGNQTDNLAKITSLRNTLNKVVATYAN